MKSLRITLCLLLVLLYTLVVLQIGFAQTSLYQSPQTRENTNTILASVVQIQPQTADGNWSGERGSGSIIDPSGLILTNYHVVADAQNQPYGKHTIVVTVDLFSEPQPKYIAEYAAGDASLDLAILRIVSDVNGALVSNLPHIPISDYRSLYPNDVISIWGYPLIGGNTITSSRGVISGFTGEDYVSAGDRWIKTDGKFDGGNSGGAAVNVSGQLVAVPTILVGQRRDTGIIETQNFLRPANFATPLIETARTGATRFVQPTSINVVPIAEATNTANSQPAPLIQPVQTQPVQTQPAQTATVAEENLTTQEAIGIVAVDNPKAYKLAVGLFQENDPALTSLADTLYSKGYPIGLDNYNGNIVVFVGPVIRKNEINVMQKALNDLGYQVDLYGGPASSNAPQSQFAPPTLSDDNCQGQGNGNNGNGKGNGRGNGNGLNNTNCSPGNSGNGNGKGRGNGN